MQKVYKIITIVCMCELNPQKRLITQGCNYTVLKFGTLVVLLDLPETFQNLFVQMSDIIFIPNKNFHNTFPMVKP